MEKSNKAYKRNLYEGGEFQKQKIDGTPWNPNLCSYCVRILNSGIKKPSNVYRATRISNLVNMLNHEEENIRYIARESLSLDMRARGVRATNGEKNFLGYELDDNDRLVKNKTYGGNSDWPDLLFQVNKLKGCVIYEDNLAKVVVNGKNLVIKI